MLGGAIGRSKGLLPVARGARARLPIVDADGMGRAFPEVPQVSMEVAGIPPSPGVMTDERGNVVVFHAISGEWMERMERVISVEFGGMASSTEYQMTAAQARGATVRNTPRATRAPTSWRGSPGAGMPRLPSPTAATVPPALPTSPWSPPSRAPVRTSNAV
jgi:DUF917 family protein